jgi:hypothetical protein
MCHLESLIETETFRFDDLLLKGIDNAPVLEINSPEMAEEETSLFHRDVSGGDDYFDILHGFVQEKLSAKNPAPIVRFADGEFAFYAKDLHCNGLYQQAESVKAIKKAMPSHLEALAVLSQIGKLAPLIYPGNVQRQRKGFFSFVYRRKDDKSALEFVEFLNDNKIAMTGENYLPFYVIYAYLTSSQFSGIVDKKRLCIISSECDIGLCRRWFARVSSNPEITFAQIPESYVATQWKSIRAGVMDKIPDDTDICLVGAGIGSVLVCVDVAARFSIPAIDAGHVLNMMNGREDKSKGPRLYTLRKGENARPVEAI